MSKEQATEKWVVEVRPRGGASTGQLVLRGSMR